MTIRFLEIAEIELDQAIHWFESQAPGLGNAFLVEVLSAADRIALSRGLAFTGRGRAPLPHQPLSLWTDLHRRKR